MKDENAKTPFVLRSDVPRYWAGPGPSNGINTIVAISHINTFILLAEKNRIYMSFFDDEKNAF